jgi:hypothetical protein
MYALKYLKMRKQRWALLEEDAISFNMPAWRWFGGVLLVLYLYKSWSVELMQMDLTVLHVPNKNG